MFISKKDLEYIREEQRALSKRIYEVEKILYNIAEAAGLKWKCSESGKWIKPNA